MKLNRRQLGIAATAAGAVALAGGTGWWFTRDEGDPKGASDQIDLLAGAYAGAAHTSDPEFFVMLSLTGGMPPRTGMRLRVFDLDGIAVSDPGEISATLQNLVTGETATDIKVTQDEGSWLVQQATVQSNGWWQLIASVGEFTASWTFLMPDPNLAGLETPPTVEPDPEASAMLVAALDTLSNRTSLRWWEWLSGGNGSIILARFSVTSTASNGEPNAFESDSILAGRIPLDGTGPSFRAENPRRISIGDEGWRSINGGTPEAAEAIQYLPISEYYTTYDGHEGAHFGITAEIEGRTCQLIAFHLPGTIVAWFAFWVDIETLFLRELFMLSVNHYMHWVYSDFDEPFIIEP